MKKTAISIDRVQINQALTVLQQQGMRCPLEDMARLCPDLTDDQLFLAIDCLTRNGQVSLTLDANGTYWIRALCLERGHDRPGSADARTSTRKLRVFSGCLTEQRTGGTTGNLAGGPHEKRQEPLTGGRKNHMAGGGRDGTYRGSISKQPHPDEALHP